jgi:V8-like Glu-specific endopeptidase
VTSGDTPDTLAEREANRKAREAILKDNSKPLVLTQNTVERKRDGTLLQYIKSITVKDLKQFAAAAMFNGELPAMQANSNAKSRVPADSNDDPSSALGVATAAAAASDFAYSPELPPATGAAPSPSPNPAASSSLPMNSSNPSGVLDGVDAVVAGRKLLHGSSGNGGRHLTQVIPNNLRRISPTTGFPWHNVGRIMYSTGGVCSGTHVSPDDAATAAHCVYKHASQRWSPVTDFVPGKDGGKEPYGR